MSDRRWHAAVACVYNFSRKRYMRRLRALDTLLPSSLTCGVPLCTTKHSPSVQITMSYSGAKGGTSMLTAVQYKCATYSSVEGKIQNTSRINADVLGVGYVYVGVNHGRARTLRCRENACK